MLNIIEHLLRPDLLVEALTQFKSFYFIPHVFYTSLKPPEVALAQVNETGS